MTALPDWTHRRLSAADYEALPEEVSRRIEIVNGAVVVQDSPSRAHQTVVRRLANTLEDTIGSGLAVDVAVDLRLRDVPLLNRRPDVVVHDSTLPYAEVLRPQHCLLVVEVMSPDSITTDRHDKPAEYAAAGIKHYWRIENDAHAGHLTAFRYRLDLTTRTLRPDWRGHRQTDCVRPRAAEH